MFLHSTCKPPFIALEHIELGLSVNFTAYVLLLGLAVMAD